MLFILTWIFATSVTQVQSVGYQSKYYTETKTVPLNDGNVMPTPAYGTYIFNLTDRKYMTQSCIWAIEAGFRHIDTANLYGVEDLIGEAISDVIKRGIVTRKDLFINTKLTFKVGTRAQVMPALKDTLKRLQLDYVDMLLIHTPRNVLNLKIYDYVEIWKGLEDAKRQGMTKSIGVSNFNETELKKLSLYTKTKPAVNQIETNPTFTNLELVTYCQSKNIIVTGYAPFGFAVPRPYNDLSLPPSFDHPILVKMTKKYDVQVSQIFLRYLVDRNIVPIAASLSKEHIKLNANIFGFSLTPADVLRINEFDRNIKVHLIDYDGLEQEMFQGYWNLKRYAQQYNLQMYKNV